jgi:uncharacterized membrane protein YjfL (UPF0719 family)
MQINELRHSPAIRLQAPALQRTRRLIAPLSAIGTAACAWGADTTASTGSWHATSLGEAIAYMLLFTAIGVVAAILGYKLFDKCTPGDLSREILENKNIAAAIVAAAVILGICIIVAAAMLG